jgi:hypothetical protein
LLLTLTAVAPSKSSRVETFAKHQRTRRQQLKHILKTMNNITDLKTNSTLLNSPNAAAAAQNHKV